MNATEATAVGVTVTDRESLVLETFAKPPRGRAMGSWKQCPLTLRPPRFPKSPLIEINPIQRCQRFHSLQVFKPPDFQAATPRIQSDSIINYLYSLRAYYHSLETLQTITCSVTSLDKLVAATGRGGVDDSPDHAQAPGSGPVAANVFSNLTALKLHWANRGADCHDVLVDCAVKIPLPRKSLLQCRVKNRTPSMLGDTMQTGNVTG